MSYEYKKQETGLMPEGDYEVRLEIFEKRLVGEMQTEKLQLQFRVRDDVEQPHKNQCLFESIWKEKDHPEFFNRKRINQLLGTQDFEDGTVFDSINDVMDAMTGACLKVHVTKVFDEYFGVEVNKVAWYRTSEHKPQSLEKPTTTTTPDIPKPTPSVAVSDDDLPF